MLITAPAFQSKLKNNFNPLHRHFCTLTPQNSPLFGKNWKRINRLAPAEILARVGEKEARARGWVKREKRQMSSCGVGSARRGLSYSFHSLRRIDGRAGAAAAAADEREREKKPTLHAGVIHVNFFFFFGFALTHALFFLMCLCALPLPVLLIVFAFFWRMSDVRLRLRGGRVGAYMRRKSSSWVIFRARHSPSLSLGLTFFFFFFCQRGFTVFLKNSPLCLRVRFFTVVVWLFSRAAGGRTGESLFF